MCDPEIDSWLELSSYPLIQSQVGLNSSQEGSEIPIQSRKGIETQNGTKGSSIRKGRFSAQTENKSNRVLGCSDDSAGKFTDERTRSVEKRVSFAATDAEEQAKWREGYK